MTNANHYKIGSFNRICAQCGQKYKDTDCKMRWDDVIVCYNCWEPKHPVLEPFTVPIDGLPIDRAQPRAREVGIDYGYNYNKWNSVKSAPAYNGRVKWNQAHFKWNVGTSTDTSTDYLFPVSGE